MKKFFYYSESARRNYFVQTGEKLASEVSIEFDPKTLSEEDRKLIYDSPEKIAGGHKFDEYPVTLEHILVHLRAKDQAEKQKYQEWIANVEAKVRRFDEILADLTKKDYSWDLKQKVRAAKSFLDGVNLSDLSEASRQEILMFPQKIDQAIALVEKKAEEAEARQKEREAELEAAKALAKQEKAEWIEAHGSERLKLAQKHGYQNQRLYATERAEYEYPGFNLDFDDQLSWKTKVGPSLEALQLLEQYPEAKIVWVEVDEDSDGDNFEAIAIQFLSKYWVWMNTEAN